VLADHRRYFEFMLNRAKVHFAEPPPRLAEPLFKSLL
jgi:hypothetical protein